MAIKKPKDIFLDPDKMVITKDIILKVLNAIEKHWDRTEYNKFQNAQYKIQMEAVKISVRMSNEKVLQDIWFSIVMCLNEVLKLNALYRDRENNSNYQKLYEIALAKLESGELFYDS